MTKNYKDSGIPFAGLIPDNWQVMRGKYILSRLQRPIKENDGIITCFRDGEVTLRSNRREDGFTIANKEFGYQGINVGDLVVHGMDGFAGAIGISDSRGKASPVLNVLDTNQDKRFLKYYLRSMAYGDVFTAWSTGIRVRSCDLGWNKIAEIRFLVPPIAEQQRIANYLDEKCLSIDCAISTGEQEIEKLKEYKQSLISNIVTKGLKQQVEYKESNVGLLGSIPSHWKLNRFKYLFSFGKGLSITKSDLVEEGVPVISYGQIHAKYNSGVRVDSRLIRYVPAGFVKNTNARVNNGDFIFADTSEDLEGIGNCVYIDTDESIYAGYHSIIARSIEHRDNRYFAYLFKTDGWRFQMRTRVSGVKVYSLPQSILGDASILVPPVDEQRSIADYLDDKCTKIDSLLSIRQEQIDRLKLYKRSLIYSCVTGKMEVPNG